MLAVQLAVAQCAEETAATVARHHSLLVCMVETGRLAFNQNPFGFCSLSLAAEKGREHLHFEYGQASRTLRAFTRGRGRAF